MIIWRRKQNYGDRNQLSGLEAGEGRALMRKLSIVIEVFYIWNVTVTTQF